MSTFLLEFLQVQVRSAIRGVKDWKSQKKCEDAEKAMQTRL